MTPSSKAPRLRAVLSRPRTFVARLVLADLIAKRGEGPLERRKLTYQRPSKR